MHIYDQKFYEDQAAGSVRSAKVLVPTIIKLLAPRSVVDVGCGVGTWLSVFSANGVEDIQGIDGPYVDSKNLLIPLGKFASADINALPDIGRKFDLSMSLEVAEHLPETSSDALVDFLANTGEAVLFSAAIPHQGGEYHVNEQWPEYWAAKFRKHGYYPADILRMAIWQDNDVEFWYRQNIMLYLKAEAAIQVAAHHNNNGPEVNALVHPMQYLQKCERIQELEARSADVETQITTLRNRIEELKNPANSNPLDAFKFFIKSLYK